MIYYLQVIPTAPDAVLVEYAYGVSPATIYGVFLAFTISLSMYFRLEIYFRDRTIRRKDEYIKSLHADMLKHERESWNQTELQLWKEANNPKPGEQSGNL